MNLNINIEVKKTTYTHKPYKITYFCCWEMIQKKEDFKHAYINCFLFLYIKKTGADILILIKCKMLLPLFSCSHTSSSLAALVYELVILTKVIRKKTVIYLGWWKSTPLLQSSILSPYLSVCHTFATHGMGSRGHYLFTNVFLVPSGREVCHYQGGGPVRWLRSAVSGRSGVRVF